VPSGFSNTVSGAAPGFIDLANRNYRLAAGTPCVDAGTNSFAYRDGNGVSGDGTPLFQYVHPLQSEPRVIQGVIDIGAYEFQSGTTDGGAGSGGTAGSAGAAGAGGFGGASGGAGGAAGASGGGGTAGASGSGGSTVGGSSGSLGASGGTAGSRTSTGGSAGAAAKSGDEGGCACQVVDSRIALGRALLAALALGAAWRLRRKRLRSVKSNSARSSFT
jgi:MYXO-CTERM domain-containing protein